MTDRPAVHPSSDETPLLQVEGLRVGILHGRAVAPVVDEVSFTLKRGEILALLGESGCGKSMTALALMGLLPEAARVLNGRVLFDGRDLLSLPPEEFRKLRGGDLGMIFQEPMTALNPVLSVGEQLREAVALHGGVGDDKNAQRKRCAELLAEVGIPQPEERLKAYPHELSGGLRQRVMIAMALAGNPRILIADEPTTALDVTVQAQIMALLDALRARRGMSVIFITHNLALAAQHADRCTVMYAGEVVESASSRDLFRCPAHPYAWMLLQTLPTPGNHGESLTTIPGLVPKEIASLAGCRFADRCPRAQETCRKARPPLSALSDGHLCRCLFPIGQGGTAKASAPNSANGASNAVSGDILEVKDLRVWFPLRSGGLFGRRREWLKAVDGVSFTLRPGETLALVGESGCGKSTIGKALIRLVEPSGGQILLPDGSDATCLRGRGLLSLRRLVQMIFQDPFSSLDPRLMVGESIAEGCHLRGLKGEAARRRVAALLAEVGLRPEDATRYPHQFSGGQRQRIGLARALAAEPAAIICDECTSALDVSVQAQILNLLRDIQRRSGVAYLFITHDLSVVGYLADRVAVMYAGRLLEEAPAAELFRNPLHPYTQVLLEAAPVFGETKPQGAPSEKLAGEMPLNGASGCPFRNRCPHAQERCARETPPRQEVAPGHFVCCFREK